jgi:LacI family transcriptional regulator
MRQNERNGLQRNELQMPRPTINDLAEAAGVSVSTVNRVVGGGNGVRQATMRRVRDAAQSIGFYGLGAIEGRIIAARPKYRFGILLQQPNRTYYQMLGQALKEAGARVADCEVEIKLEFMEELTPQNIAARMLKMGEVCDAIGVVAAVHPLVTQAIDGLQRRGVPVFALISQLAATGDVHYVGLDNWKVGRTAAWTIHNVCKAPGKLGILVGNHRYRSQEMNETGFRSYFREYAPEFTLLEPLTTFETSAVAQEMAEKLLREHPDLKGLYVAGGGISGAIAALRASDKAGHIAAVGYQLMDNTRAALLDGVLTLVISQPLARIGDEVVSGMIEALNARSGHRTFTSVLPFDIYTRENI